MKHKSTRPSNPRALVFGACATLLTGTLSAEQNFLAWQSHYDHAQSSTQQGVAVAMDSRGNVFVTGYHDGSSDTWYTAKYDSLTGALVWDDTFAAAVGDARPASIATDSDGNVIVTGYTNTANGHDYYTIKYDGADGTRLWQRTYNNAQNGSDEARKVVVDGSDNVIITGRSIGAATNFDFHTIKYNSSGTFQWERRYTTSFTDEPRDLAVDGSGNVAVTGRSRVGSDECIYTAKYNSATGAVTWQQTFDGAENRDDEGNGVAIDGSGNVLITGTVRKANGDYSFQTIKYSSAAGTVLWQKTFTSAGGDTNGPTGIGVDSAGNAIIGGTSRLDGFKVTFYVAKYASANGATLWENRTTAPAGSPANAFVDDDLNALIVDAAGNLVATGSRQREDVTDDYYTVKFDGATGAILWEQQLNGDRDAGNDYSHGVAVDPGGNVAITGTARKADPSAFFEIISVKYTRFLLTIGDPVQGTGLTDAAVVASLTVPALADTGAIAVRIGVKDGRKRFAAVLAQGAAGGNTITALQGQPAPGVTGGEFKSFKDPVIAPNATHAFIGKLSGVPGSQATGVWTNTFTGTLQLALQTGKQVPGLPAGVLLNSVTSISLRNFYLAALITVKGTGITGANKTVLLGMTSPTTGFKLLQGGDPVTVDAQAGTIKSLSVYKPAKTSPGHGRYHGDLRFIASAVLADKRNVLLGVSNGGVVTPFLASGGAAANVANGAEWKSFGPPAIATNGFNYAALATLVQKSGGVDGTNDSVIVTSVNGASFDDLAREGAAAPGAGTAVFGSFSDPVSAPGALYAFAGSLKGQGVTGSNKNGLWFGTPGALALVARADGLAPDSIGNPGTAKFPRSRTWRCRQPGQSFSRQ